RHQPLRSQRTAFEPQQPVGLRLGGRELADHLDACGFGGTLGGPNVLGFFGRLTAPSVQEEAALDFRPYARSPQCLVGGGGQQRRDANLRETAFGQQPPCQVRPFRQGVLLVDPASILAVDYRRGARFTAGGGEPRRGRRPPATPRL